MLSNAPSDPPFHRVVAALRGARRALVITGAGLSADSGLPTYRGVGGLYEDRDTRWGMPIEEVLSAGTFARNPALTWQALRQIEEACRGATPNDGHRAIAELQQHVDDVVVLTQNVDGFHRAAGSRDVIEIHGDLHNIHCTACPRTRRVEDYRDLAARPLCAACGADERPHVVLFGEMLPTREVSALQSAVADGFDVVLSVGTTSVFPYIAQPIHHTRATGGLTVEINPGTTAVSDAVDIRLVERAAPTLRALVRAIADA